MWLMYSNALVTVSNTTLAMCISFIVALAKYFRTRLAVYVERNIEASWCNHCYSGKAMSITHFECVFVALGIRRAMRVRHIVIYGLPHSTIFFHVIL